MAVAIARLSAGVTAAAPFGAAADLRAAWHMLSRNVPYHVEHYATG